MENITNKENDLENLLKAAKKERKGDWNVYSSYKNQIDSLMLTNNEYDDAIKKLCNILRV